MKTISLKSISIGGRIGGGKPNGNPSALTATVISDTVIQLDWTIGSTNQDGHKIYISTDNVNFTLKGTVTGTTATYNAETLTAGTLYYFKVIAYKGSKLSSYSNTVSETTIPNPDALFDTRTSLNITDSIGSEVINIKSFPVANYKTTVGAAFYTAFETNEAPITVGGDWTFIGIARNEVSDSVTALADFLQLAGGNRGIAAYLRSGALYNNIQSVSAGDPLFTHPAKAQIVGQSDPWIVGVTYDESETTVKDYLNGVELDSSASGSAWASGGTGKLNWRGFANLTDCRIFAIFIFDRILSTVEMAAIASTGTFPADVPSRMYVHSNYNDTTSNRLLGSHNRNAAVCTSNGSNIIIPDRATMWTYRYDNPVFAYPLLYGYTGFGNYKIPYAPTSAKLMTSATGDIEFPASNCIHNMAESRLYFNNISDADIKAIFDKSNRTYWKASIESEDSYVDAGSGYYGVWHPSQLSREFITTHAATGHANHIFASLRTSGQTITGITAIRVYKTNLS